MIKDALALQTFDARHFAPFLGPLEPIDQHDRPPIDPDQVAAEQMLNRLPPELGQTIEIQGGGMKEVEQAVITGVGEPQRPDQAGDPRQVGAEAQSR